MSPRQFVLHQFHEDTARLITSQDAPFYVVLDLADPRAFDIAEASGEDPDQLRRRRDACESMNEIAAWNLGLTADMAFALFFAGWQVRPFPIQPQDRFLAVVSEGRLTVRRLTKSN